MSIFGPRRPEDESARAVHEGKLSIIAAGTVLEGNLLIEGDMRIEGRIIGTVICRSRLVIGMQGEIEGNLDAQNASIAGKVSGQVVVRDTLNLLETGRISGDILADKIITQAGAIFSGNIRNGKEATDAIQRLGQPEFLKRMRGTASLPPPVNLNPVGRPGAA